MAMKNQKRMSKKGIFFTGISILLLGLLIYLITSNFEFDLRKDSLSTGTRIRTMNSFITDVNKDVERAIYISGMRSLISMSEYITDNDGKFIGDFDQAFSDFFLNGTYDGNDSIVMVNSTFNDWVSRIQVEGEKFDLTINITAYDIAAYHISPWEIAVEINYTINLTDGKNIARWDSNESVIALLPIEGMDEPLTIVNSGGKVVYQIKEKNVTFFVNQTDLNASNLLYFVAEKQFVASNISPSYIMRLEGEFGNSTYGIETILDLDVLIGVGIPVIRCNSWVDHLYWQDVSADWSNFTDVSKNISLDDDRIPVYELDNSKNPSSC